MDRVNKYICTIVAGIVITISGILMHASPKHPKTLEQIQEINIGLYQPIRLKDLTNPNLNGLVDSVKTLEARKDSLLAQYNSSQEKKEYEKIINTKQKRMLYQGGVGLLTLVVGGIGITVENKKRWKESIIK